MNGTDLEDHIHDLVVEVGKPKLQLPRMYKVILMNDDYTTMDFVIEVLQFFFHMDARSATQVMWQVHNQGCGICGVFNRDIAETKVAMVNDYSRKHENPLLCTMETE